LPRWIVASIARVAALSHRLARDRRLEFWWVVSNRHECDLFVSMLKGGSMGIARPEFAVDPILAAANST
jgi:hypothetical protein